MGDSETPTIDHLVMREFVSRLPSYRSRHKRVRVRTPSHVESSWAVCRFRTEFFEKRQFLGSLPIKAPIVWRALTVSLNLTCTCFVSTVTNVTGTRAFGCITTLIECANFCFNVHVPHCLRTWITTSGPLMTQITQKCSLKSGTEANFNLWTLFGFLAPWLSRWSFILNGSGW